MSFAVNQERLGRLDLKVLNSCKKSWPRLRVGLFLLVGVVFWASFWSQAISFQPTGIYISSDAMWGDWAAHLTMVNRMVADKLILTQSPFILGQPFGYPFAVNLISALLVRAGMSLFTALILPSFFLCVAGTILLYYWLRLIFNSRAVGIIGTTLFYLNGGWGFLYQPSYLPTQKNTLFPAKSIHVMNVVESSFLPQRAFALGFPLVLLILIVIWRQFVTPSRKLSFTPNWKVGLLLGSLTGLMPLIHTHSFLVLFFILAGWSLGSWWLTPHAQRKSVLIFWLSVAGTAGIISVPIIRTFFSANLSNQFFKWFPGWYSHEDQVFWPWFWWLNWGPTLIMAVTGSSWLITKLSSQKSNLTTWWRAVFLAPFWLIFILINFIQFQPNIWDNTKLWVYSSVGLSGLAGYFLVQAWRKKQGGGWKNTLFRSGVAVFFMLAITAGTLDNYHLLRVKDHRYRLYSVSELELAEWVKHNTPVDSTWLTSDQHNHWLDNLTGRQAVMGYRGWLWTHGYQYQPLEKDVSDMFRQPLEHDELFAKYDIDYVVVGPQEINSWQANQAEFDQLQLIKESANYKIYAL